MKRAVAPVAVLLLLSCGSRPSAPPPAAPVTSAPAPVVAPPAPHVPTPLVDPGMRLPRDVAITSYGLELEIDPSRPTMRGTVAISGDVTRATDVVWLHAENLTIRDAIARVDDQVVRLEPHASIARGKLDRKSVV